MRRRDFLITGTLTGSLTGCLRLVEEDTDSETTNSNTRTRTTEDEVDNQPTTNTETTTDTEEDRETETAEEENDEQTVTVSGSWTSFGNGPSNAGVAESAEGVGEYEILWKKELSMESSAGPIVADGTLYTYGDGLTAIDAASGDIRWTVPISGGRSTPTYMDDGIVAGNSERTAFVDLEGDVEWEITSGGDGHAVTEEKIYTAGQGNVWAFDLEGELAWSERIDKRTTAVPAVADGILCVGTREGQLIAFDADSGSQEWTFEVSTHSEQEDPAGYDIFGGVTIYDGTAYFGTWDRTVYAVDIEAGELEWMQVTYGGIDVCPAAADGTIYVGNDSGQIIAFDATTGDREWESMELGGSLGQGVALADDTVYSVGDDGVIAAVDRDDGTLRWRHLMSRKRPQGSPAVVDGFVFMTDGAGTVYAFTES